MNYNNNLCLARLKSNYNKQCSRKSKPNCIFCGTHLKMINNGKILKTIDIDYKLLSIYKYNKKEILLIQKTIRGFLIRNNNYLRGPALFKRHLSNNKSDFLNFEKITKIPYYYFFSFKDLDNFIYSFNIKSINYLINNKNKNPYNRNILDNNIKTNILKLLKSNKKLDLKINFINYKNPYLIMKQNCIKIFQRMDELKLYTQPDWFLQLNLKQLKKLYLEIKDLWEYRSQLNNLMRLTYVKTGKIFNLKIYNVNAISNKLELQNLLLKEFNRMIHQGITDTHCITSCYWILTCLTMVSHSAAMGYPHLVQSHAFIHS